MALFSLTQSEHEILRNVIDTLEYDLDDVDAKPHEWSETKYIHVFQSVMAKLRSYSAEISLTAEECELLRAGIVCYVQYADRFDEEPIPAEIIRQLRELVNKLKSENPT